MPTARLFPARERKKPRQRGIDGMLERLAPGDRLIVSELSRLGRSLGQVIHIVDELVVPMRVISGGFRTIITTGFLGQEQERGVLVC